MYRAQLSPTLSYAPPAKTSSRWTYVIAAGVLTTALTLAGTAWLAHQSNGKINLLGIYIDGIIPIGALILGASAASGYAVAAWLLGCRIRRPLLLGICGLTLLAYGLMHYLEFMALGPLIHRATGLPVTFLEHFDYTTRSIHFVSTFSPTSNSFDPQRKEAAQGLGLLGYGVRALEAGAFSTGAILTPFLALRKKKYCDLCEQYYVTLRLGLLPASVPPKKTMGFLTPSSVKLDGEHAVAGRQAQQLIEQMAAYLQNGQVEEFGRSLAGLQADSSATKKLPRRAELLLSWCTSCGQAIFHSNMITGLNGRKTRSREIIAVPVEAALAAEIRSLFLSRRGGK